jgi:hypothetical protein
MFSEVGLRGMPECQPLRDCKKCFEAAAHFQGGEFYVYVLREGQEVMEEVVFVASNCISLCGPCHRKEHAEDEPKWSAFA